MFVLEVECIFVKYLWLTRPVQTNNEFHFLDIAIYSDQICIPYKQLFCWTEGVIFYPTKYVKFPMFDIDQILYVELDCQYLFNFWNFLVIYKFKMELTLENR